MTSTDRSAVGEWLARLGRPDRSDVSIRLTAALRDLLHLRVPPTCAEIASWAEMSNAITGHVMAAIPSAEREERVAPLIRTFITPSPDTLEAAVSILVADTAEILFLPRAERRMSSADSEQR